MLPLLCCCRVFWPSLFQRPGIALRYTPFVEIMAPGDAHGSQLSRTAPDRAVCWKGLRVTCDIRPFPVSPAPPRCPGCSLQLLLFSSSGAPHPGALFHRLGTGREPLGQPLGLLGLEPLTLLSGDHSMLTWNIVVVCLAVVGPAQHAQARFPRARGCSWG